MEEDGIVSDDIEPPRYSFNYYQFLMSFVSRYGWYLLFTFLILYQVYARYIRPLFDRIREDEEVASRKKYDDDVGARVKDGLRAARERQQAHHDAVAAEAEALRKKREEEKLAKAREELAKRSVLENALLAKTVSDSKKKKTGGQGDADESAGEFLLRSIRAGPIVIISKSFCSYSRKVKSIFATYRLPREEVVYVELDELGEKREKEVQAELKRLYDKERVPAVFVSGDLIGDADAVVAMQREGILDVLVKDATTVWRAEKK